MCQNCQKCKRSEVLEGILAISPNNEVNFYDFWAHNTFHQNQKAGINKVFRNFFIFKKKLTSKTRFRIDNVKP